MGSADRCCATLEALRASLAPFTRKVCVMRDPTALVSTAFQTFMAEAPAHAQAWSTLVQGLAQASALDAKTAALAYLAVLAALRLESGIPFHVHVAS